MIGGGIIRSVMSKRGFKHRRAEDQFSIRGEYARNLQYVYSQEYPHADGNIIDLVYFSADMLGEKIVIGFYRENPYIDNGVLINTTRSIDLTKFSSENINREIDKLIPPVKDRFK